MWSENGCGLGVSVNLWLEKWRHCSLCELLVLWMGLKGFGSNVLITWSSGMCKCIYITFPNISIAISLNVIGRLRAKLFSNQKRPMLNINVTNWSDKCNRPEHFLFRSMSVACFSIYLRLPQDSIFSHTNSTAVSNLGSIPGSACKLAVKTLK